VVPSPGSHGPEMKISQDKFSSEISATSLFFPLASQHSHKTSSVNEKYIIKYMLRKGIYLRFCVDF